MSKATFFSNTLNYFDIAENEVISSLANTRPEPRRVFTVPQHNINTNNLIIMINGAVKIRDVDYEDINSSQIRFFNSISIGVDFHSILIKNKGENGTPSSDISWGSF